MFHKDESKISKTRSHFSRFANYLRVAFGKSHTAKKDKTHGSMDDLNGSTSNTVYANDSSLNIGESGADSQVVNHASSVGNLTERTSSSPSTPPSSSRFRDELAAKLSAGPGFPFGGLGGPPRMGVVAPPATVNHSIVASGDTTPGSLSPGSPATSGYGSRERNPSESTGEGDGIKDAYIEGAMLRINLNRQRKHRAQTNLSSIGSGSGTAATSSVASASLHRISEVENADSPSRKTSTSSSQHSPPIHPKPRVYSKPLVPMTFETKEKEEEEEREVSLCSPKPPTPKTSTSGLEVAQPRLSEHAEVRAFDEEKATKKAENDVSNEQTKSVGSEEWGCPRYNNEASRSSRPPSAYSQDEERGEEDEKGVSSISESPTSSHVPSSSGLMNTKGVRMRSSRDSDHIAHPRTIDSRCISTPGGFLSQPQLRRLNSGNEQKQESSSLTLSPKVEEEIRLKSTINESSQSLQHIASSPNPEASSKKHQDEPPVEGFSNVYSRASSTLQNPPNDGASVLTMADDVATNRNSRVHFHSKTFQQQQSGAI